MFADLYNEFTKVLRTEADAIYRSIDQIDKQEVQKALNILIACEGKIVLIGLGKPGHIAHKIAATLTSTGSPAIVLSASDALHGDIGILSSKDVLIALSNSGETQELLAIIPHIKNRKVPLISIVGDKDSSLAKYSDVVLNSNIEKEACPNNLAPTTSTTLALAIGDALAVCLMLHKNIKHEDFAFNHPGGKLGKRLSLQIKDLMQINTPLLTPEASWKEVLENLTFTKIGGVAIVDKDILLGLITDGDIRRYVINSPNTAHVKASDIMTRKPLTVSTEMFAYEALTIMENRATQISVLPVIDENGVYIGIIRIHDILGKI